MGVSSLLRNVLRRSGFDVVPYAPRVDPVDELLDLSAAERMLVRHVQPYTMTSLARLASLIQATQHVARQRVPGDIVECGVWRGGSMMAIARTLIELGDTTRKLYLYDTFTGMSPPTDRDRQHDGEAAQALLERDAPDTGIWCYATLEDAKENLRSTGYPEENLVFVQGKVEETIPARAPSGIALLRLDTDWYESTRHELLHLYPRLSRFGVLIIDDYGHWQGARAAVDEYIAALPYPLHLHRIDYTGRASIKPEA